MAGKNKLFTPILPPPVALPKAGEREEGKGADKDRKKKTNVIWRKAREESRAHHYHPPEKEKHLFSPDNCACVK